MSLEDQINELRGRIIILEQILFGSYPKSQSCNGLNLAEHTKPADVRGFFLSEESQGGKSIPLTQPYCKAELSHLATPECNQSFSSGIQKANGKLRGHE